MAIGKKFVFFFLVMGSYYSFAQTVKTTKQTQRIKNEEAAGYTTTIEAAQPEVNAALQRYLKTFGKPKQQSDVWMVPEATINGKVNSQSLYGSAKPNGAKTAVWMGVLVSVDSTSLSSQLEGLVKTFGINFYRDKIQTQIDEAQRAVEAVEKQQQRTATENKNILLRTENNGTEFAQLSKAIKSNRKDSVDLNLRMNKNLQAKDSLVIVLEKVKRALELQKERQRRVN